MKKSSLNYSYFLQIKYLVNKGIAPEEALGKLKDVYGE